MIVCACTGTTDADLVRLIRNGASSVAEIVQKTGAGRCCTPCHKEIGLLLDELRAPQAQDER